MSEETPKIPGVRRWKNRGNGFSVFELHYSADPAKRSPEWKKKASYGMDPKAWSTEMELQREVYAGQPVFGSQFSMQLHVAAEQLLPNPDQPTLVRGWDFGGNHSVAIMQLLGQRVSVLDEYANMGFNTRIIAAEVVRDCSMRYGPGFRYVDVIDPSGLHEGKTSTGLACADVMRDLGLEIIPGEQGPDRRIDAAMQLMITMSDGRPNLQFSPSCKMLIAGALGGWHFPERETQNQKQNRPVKNEYSHIWDAACYGFTRIMDVGSAETFVLEDPNAPSGGYRIA